MRLMTALAAAALLSASVAGAHAACDQQQLYGTWHLYFTIPFKNWAHCRLSIDGGGDVIGDCRSTTGITRQLSGHLTVTPATCALSGQFRTTAAYRIVEAHMADDGAVAAGYMDNDNGFTMVRARP